MRQDVFVQSVGRVATHVFVQNPWGLLGGYPFVDYVFFIIHLDDDERPAGGSSVRRVFVATAVLAATRCL